MREWGEQETDKMSSDEVSLWILSPRNKVSSSEGQSNPECGQGGIVVASLFKSVSDG